MVVTAAGVMAQQMRECTVLRERMSSIRSTQLELNSSSLISQLTAACNSCSR